MTNHVSRPRKFKAWFFQHGILPCIMDFDVASTVENLETMLNKRPRHWFGLPPSMTNIGLYSQLE